MNLQAFPASYWPYAVLPYTGATAPAGGWVVDEQGRPILDYEGNPIPAATTGQMGFQGAIIEAKGFPLGWVLLGVGGVALGAWLYFGRKG